MHDSSYLHMQVATVVGAEGLALLDEDQNRRVTLAEWQVFFHNLATEVPFLHFAPQ